MQGEITVQRNQPKPHTSLTSHNVMGAGGAGGGGGGGRGDSAAKRDNCFQTTVLCYHYFRDLSSTMDPP